jgi:hypothetical protein
LKQQIQALNWKMPRQALEKITASAPKLFAKCLLFGFSSRDYFGISFFKLLQKIAHHVTFFAFDWGDSELATFEWLENIFGPAENISENNSQKTSTAQANFILVDDPIDAATYIQALLSPAKIQGNTGIICPSPSFATLVAHHLETAQIPFHNGFPRPISTSRDNLAFAWHRWQVKNDLKSFICFCNFLQHLEPNLLPQDIDIGKILIKIFNNYPSLHVQDLTNFSENPCLKNVLEHYPMLDESGSFHEFSQKTGRIIPEIMEAAKHFLQDFQVTKKAFLDYAFHLHFESKPDISSPASIFLLDPFSASQLQFDKMIIFSQNTSNSTPFPISSLQAKGMHYIAIKSNVSQEFMECYSLYTGKNLDTNAIQSVYLSSKKITQNNSKQYDFLRKIHKIRNNEHSVFGAFEYMIPEIQNYSLPITAIERAYSDPEEIWYRYILKNDYPQLSFEKSKFEGILTHYFLHWPHDVLPSFHELQRHIALQKQHFQQKFSNISPQILLQEAIGSSETKASIMAKKLTTFETFPFIINEVDLHASTTLSKGISLPLHGRIDCILSLYPFRKTFHKDNAQNNMLIVDFKTGTTSQSDLQKLVKKFTSLPQSLTGLQLVLYGLMLRTLGYQHIQLLILNGDPYDHAEPLHLDMITSGENFKFIQKYSKTLLNDGIFGYSQSHPFGKTYFSPPIAILPPKNEAIQSKRKQLFS